MAEMTLEAYKQLVETQGRALLNVIARGFAQSVAMGDLSMEVEVPEGIEVLSDLAVGIQIMIDDLRDMMHNEAQARLVERQSRALLSVVQSVAMGELDVVVDVPEGIEELSELAVGIEMMVDDIRTMLQEQERARAELSASHQQLETTLEEMRSVQRRYIQQEWSEYAAATPGYVFTAGAGAPQPLDDEPMPEMWREALDAALARSEAVVVGEDAVVRTQSAARTRSAARTLTLPITWAGETIGVLGLNRQSPLVWNVEDIAVVKEVVEQAGWALENQRLFEEALRARLLLSKQVRELDCLNDIGRKIVESPAIPELLQWTAERIPQAMQHTDVCLVTIEYAGRFYGDIEAVDLSRQMVAGMYVGDESIGRVLVAYREDHAAEMRREFSRRESSRYAFLDSESALLGDVARRLTGYIENRRLLEQTEMRARHEQALLQIAAAVGGSEDLKGILDALLAVVDPLRRLAPVDALSMATYTAGENEVTVFEVLKKTRESSRDVEHFSPLGARIPLEGSGPGWVVTYERLWREDDLRKKPTFAEDMNLIEEGAVSRLLLPLRFGERVIGVLDMASVQPAAFTAERVALLTQVATQLAQAMEHARLLASTRAALAAEAETRRSYERREWQTYLQEHHKVRQNTFVYDQGEVHLAPDFWRPEVQRALRDVALATSAQAHDEAELPGLASRLRTTDKGDDKRVGLAVPIEMRGQVIGVLGVEDPEGEWRASPDHLALIQAVAQQLGQALESARLIEDTQRRAAREQMAGEITGRIREAVEIEAVLERALTELGRAFAAERGTAYLALSGQERDR